MPPNRFDDVVILIETDPRVGVVLVDPAQIQQLLTNLFFNSADAMRDAGCRQSQIRLRIDYLAARGVVSLTLADTGPGIPDDVRHHIFEPGFTTKSDGHGFGLSTVFRIVQNHNGFIFVENTPDGGAQFRIQLPAQTTRALSAA